MKQTFNSIVVLLALLLGAVSANAATNSLFVSGNAPTLSYGEQTSINFCLNNGEDLYGFQATITVPSFLEIVDCALGTRTDNTYSLTVNRVSSTSIKVATVSLNPIIENVNAPLFILTVKAVKEGVEQGAVNVTDVIFTNGNGEDVLVSSCSASVNLQATLVSAITLNYTSLELQKQEVQQLSATVTPENAVNKAITWSSDNASVATVSDAGLVTAVSAGEATITVAATDGSGVKATCKVIVAENSNRPSTVTNYLEVADQTAFVGKDFTLPIEMVNDSEFCAFQFDLYLPAGVDVATNDRGKYAFELTDRKSDHTISSNKQTDGAIRVIVVSLTNDILSGNDGVLINVPLVISEDATGGENIVKVTNISLVTNKSVTITPPDVTSILTVVDYILGDSNGDGSVALADVVNMINYALGVIPETFVEAASDINSDGKVNVTDIVTVINMILNVETANDPA